MNTEIAKYNTDSKITVADPFSPDTYHASPDGIIKSMFDRRDAHRRAFDALGDLDEAPLGAVKELRREIEEDDKRLLDYNKEMLDALLALSGFKAVQTQLKGAKARIDPASVRGVLAEMLKALKAREDAEKIVLPPATWVVRIEANEDQMKKIIAAATEAGATGILPAKAQTDKAVKQIVKWFEENA